MKAIDTPLPGLCALDVAAFGDARGFFMETWNAARYAAAGMPSDWVQDNLSRSAQHTVRGLHFQAPPHAQAKLVSCLEGAIFDVAVDLRRGSPTFGQWYGAELSAANRRQLFVPVGCAHGFLVTSASALVTYKVAGGAYAPSHEGTLAWNDPALGIAWPLPAGAEPLVSEKDRAGRPLAYWAEHTPFVYG